MTQATDPESIKRSVLVRDIVNQLVSVYLDTQGDSAKPPADLVHVVEIAYGMSEHISPGYHDESLCQEKLLAKLLIPYVTPYAVTASGAKTYAKEVARQLYTFCAQNPRPNPPAPEDADA